jgi:hypothetical protein
MSSIIDETTKLLYQYNHTATELEGISSSTEERYHGAAYRYSNQYGMIPINATPKYDNDAIDYEDEVTTTRSRSSKCFQSLSWKHMILYFMILFVMSIWFHNEGSTGSRTNTLVSSTTPTTSTSRIIPSQPQQQQHREYYSNYYFDHTKQCLFCGSNTNVNTNVTLFKSITTSIASWWYSITHWNEHKKLNYTEINWTTSSLSMDGTEVNWTAIQWTTTDTKDYDSNDDDDLKVTTTKTRKKKKKEKTTTTTIKLDHNSTNRSSSVDDSTR